MFSVGEVVSVTKLNSTYDKWFRMVLGDALQTQERKRGRGQKSMFKVVKALPSKLDYQKMAAQRFTVSVDSLIEDAYNIAGELRDEMQEAFDNMPESLQGGDIGSRREEAASALDDVANNQPDSCDAEINAIFRPHLDANSRSKRAAEAADMLQTAAGAIREYIESLEAEEEGEKVEGEEVATPAADVDALNDLADHIEDDASNLENVDFPGMYG